MGIYSHKIYPPPCKNPVHAVDTIEDVQEAGRGEAEGEAPGYGGRANCTGNQPDTVT